MIRMGSTYQKVGLRYLILIIICLFFSKMYSQEAEGYFEKGNKAYASGNFQEAIDAYNQVLDAGQESAALYFNLANANYKLNRIAPSVYNYERALQLNPNDSDIKNNLVFAQNMTIDAITPLPQNTFTKWYNAILKIFTIDEWAIFAVVMVLIFMGSFIAYRFVYATSQKRFFFSTTLLALLISLAALFFAFRSQTKMENDRPAIFFSPAA
ncbi:MAG: tetratricopeptide repeat protein [Leeuwenhoekiella sp.]